MKFLPLVSVTIILGLLIGASKTSNAQNTFVINTTDIQTVPAKPVVAQPGTNPAPVSNGSPQSVINQRAITIIGQGQVTAPADTARLEFRLITRDVAQTPVAGLKLPSESGEEAGTLLALKPLVEALVALKVPEKDIQIRANSTETPQVIVNLSKPTKERIEQVVGKVNKAASSNQVIVQSVGAVYTVANCQPLEREARKIALSDARNQINSFAQDLGVKIGDVFSVTVFPSSSSASASSCGTKVGVPVSPFALSSETVPPYDPSVPPQVEVRSQVSVTYSIKD
jgi:uncharacterized protein YggE